MSLGTQKLPGKKALLLIPSGKSAKISGALERTQEQLGKAGAAYVVCANIHENPTKELVMEAAAVAKENGCDFIVALGGGAVLDSATAISAINCWGVISKLDTHEKIGFGSPILNPVLAIVDPELMRTVPAKYTAYQGFDALFHNTEVMMSSGINVLSETVSLSAID